MDSSSEEVGASLAESGQQIGGSETTGLSHLDTGFLEFQNLEVDAGEILEPLTNLDFADLLGLPDDNAGYSPSVCTDFSWFLPETSVGNNLGVASKGLQPGNIDAISLEDPFSRERQTPLGTGLLGQFLDLNQSVMDMMGKEFKRTLPAPVAQESGSASSREVERRVFPRPFQEVKGFMQHVRDIPGCSWQEELGAMLETSVRSWVALTDTWLPESSTLIAVSHNCKTFKEKARILVDVFYNKSPQALMKRVNRCQRLCTALQVDGIRFPCGEEQVYNFLKQETVRGAPSSTLKSFFEALVFVRNVFSVDALQALTGSRRCTSAAFTRSLNCPKQAEHFTVKQLQVFHAVLRESEEIWNRVMAGMVLFVSMQELGGLTLSTLKPCLKIGILMVAFKFLEAKNAVSEMARAYHFETSILPMASPAFGITDDNWGLQWTHVQRVLKIDDLTRYPLMPATDSMLEPTWRPSTTREAKMWMHELLDDTLNRAPKDTSHFCKCTCFSNLAKRGGSFEDRLILGYHANPIKMALVYSRARAAQLLALLAHVLNETQRGVFDPDCTRSGRLKTAAAPFDQVEAFAVNSNVRLTLSELNAGQQVESCSEGSWQKVVENQTKPGAEILSKDMSPHMQVTRRTVKAMPLHR